MTDTILSHVGWYWKNEVDTIQNTIPFRGVNKIKYIARDYRNSENNIKFNIEYRIFKRFNNKLINFK